MSLSPHFQRFIAAPLLGLVLATALPALAQDGAAPAATALTSSGIAEVELSGIIRDGDKLTLRLRMKPVEAAKRTNETVYSSISDQAWEEEFYLLSGDKKYLLLKDSAGKPLASASLMLSVNDAPLAGSWNGTFPAPPAGATATLYLPKIEPIGPFTVPE